MGAGGWGPGRAPAALSVTFDNLGEAADQELGLWPDGRAPGRHFSVTRVLPRLLALLDELGLRATFFVEGVNAGSYPEALREIAERGHELGLHAWRHEEWGGLDEPAEAELLDRGTRALAGLGHPPRGFRPPGGRLTARTRELLGASGYLYASPHGERPQSMPGLVLLPFQWELVDAYFHFPRVGGLRARLVGEGPAGASRLGPRARSALFRTAVRVGSIRGAGRLRAAMLRCIRELPGSGGHRCLVFHPFLLDWRRSVETMSDVLREAARLGQSGALWLAPMADVARSLPEEPA